MPYINRVRITNIKYNDGNNYYEDFVLKMGGTHTLIDMINGLGKTFFLQCMAQPMLPGAKFKQEFPLSLLFDNKNNNNTIHSLVEWRLDQGSAFKYALVGFCAYKKEKVEQVNFLDEEENGEFGTMLYITYYNEPNAYDLESLPLVTVKEDGTKKIMNYKELEGYLKKLMQTPLREYSVVMNRTKKDHLKELAKLNINSVEWKHLMGINASEANAEKYLRSYSTASSFIQDFLIPTIEESYRLRHEGDYQTEESRAKTLLNLRQTLLTLQQKEALEAEYTYIEEACERIYEQLGKLGKAFQSKEDLVTKLSEMSLGITQDQSFKEQEKSRLIKETQELESLLGQYKMHVEHLNRQEQAYSIKEAQEKLNALGTYLQELEQAFGQKDEALNALKEKKTYYEAEKLYGEYESFKMRKALKEEELGTRAKEHKELMADYNYWGNVYGNLLFKQFRTSTKAKEEAENALEALKAEYHESCLERERIKTTLGHTRVQVAEKEKAIHRIQEQLSALQKEFKHLTKEQLEEEYEANKSNCETLKAKIEALKVDMEEAKSSLNDKLQARKLLELEKQHQALRVLNLRKILAEVRTGENLINQLKAKYDTQDLMGHLNKALVNLHKGMSQKETKKKECEEKLSMLELSHGVVLSACARRQYKRVSDSYPSAVLGSSFLQSQSEDEKKALLERTTLLPYSILVDEVDFRKLVRDTKLRRTLEDEVLPIINQDALLEGEDLQASGITFTTKDVDYFMDVDLREKELRKLKKELVSLEQDLKDLEAQVKVVTDHQALVLEITKTYPEEKVEGFKAELVEAIHKDEALEEQQRQLEEALCKEETKLQEMKETLEQEHQAFTTISKVLEGLEQECEALKKWEADHQTQVTLERELSELSLTLKNCEKTLGLLEETIEHFGARQTELTAHKDTLTGSYHEIRIQVEHFTFKVEENTEYDVVDMPYEEAKLKYEMYDQRLREEAGDVKQLEQAIKECAESMEHKVLEMVAKGEQFTTDYFTTRSRFEGDYLSLLKQLEIQIGESSKLYEAARTNVEAQKVAYASQEGALGNMKAQFLKEYRMTYEEMILEEGEIQACLIKVKDEKGLLLQNIKKCQNEQNQKSKALVDLEETLKNLNHQREKLNGLMYHYGLQYIETIQATRKMESFDAIEQETREVLRALESTSNGYSLLLKEVLDYLEAPELIHFKGDLDRLLLEGPKDEEMCNLYRGLIGGEGGYLENVREEKVRIKETIEALKKDEESFINQCIQKCEQVYNDLMSLAHLSKIELYGRSQEMIRIIVTPLEEELRFAKMKSYINNLVEQVESIEDNKKQAYLAGRLTLRELFGAFVVNIKKSDVRVYKVEDIKENSRELPWSRAIGSTGQSNGMYMSIFICLISYIRKLYNPHIGEDSRKFIMLDSPFSGTAAAYIWEPVIKLLDRNNVQLLCVGYDIPQHLMSLFDVKYNLASEYDQNKKQTIVVEHIKSHINLDALSFDKLLGEQMVL